MAAIIQTRSNFPNVKAYSVVLSVCANVTSFILDLKQTKCQFTQPACRMSGSPEVPELGLLDNAIYQSGDSDPPPSAVRRSLYVKFRDQGNPATVMERR
ncbi:hypothetical protein BFJ68_g16540 [Fusarium oxysporum]|uniref:Uncharacterized protein n=1 Tax=Fusarium oxysporum TaxID=5507 RepID=A0A420PC64_FUSOX|nr:hypothetical protein BFJ67_g16297 [Fusarium oxysporum f. sp. cepae]RKK27921.1 hypothetical protein BFJ66_g16439 [Fusarium oxysporum f. sp. cepae]RKK65718.1 hypothetical protein BFJ69_g16047 [Fusarium oxysporum]RKK90110.1 hypothetical protein BFJ68_g16540 [Fusarium oxysporum]